MHVQNEVVITAIVLALLAKEEICKQITDACCISMTSDASDRRMVKLIQIAVVFFYIKFSALKPLEVNSVALGIFDMDVGLNIVQKFNIQGKMACSESDNRNTNFGRV